MDFYMMIDLLLFKGALMEGAGQATKVLKS